MKIIHKFYCIKIYKMGYIGVNLLPNYPSPPPLKSTLILLVQKLYFHLIRLTNDVVGFGVGAGGNVLIHLAVSMHIT